MFAFARRFAKTGLAWTALTVIALSATFSQGAHAQSNAGIQMLLGNPSGAGTSTSTNYNNYLIQRPQYSLSYSRDRAIPNWVSWHLGAQDLGSATRTTSFSTDTTLPSGWYEATTSNYTNTGYDRGHNCPSADRTATAADNKALFLMSNIMPQAPDNNQGPWEALETYCRSLVSAGDECYIICGSYGTATTIASGKIAVPSYTYKIIVVLTENNSLSDLSRVTASTRVITVKMPNVQGIRSVDWKTYRTSFSTIESATGYTFLSNVSSSIRSTLRTKVDNQ